MTGAGQELLVDATLAGDIARTGPAAAAIEAAGYEGIWIEENKHEPFLRALRAADATQRTIVGTAVAIAFSRSPMTTAYAAYDLAHYSHGRFVLGLGSQVKAHIERRFSMPWSRPAARMREYILALRTIWTAWHEQEPLEFSGDFYTHTLMPPFFAPTPHPFGPPPVYLAGVGPHMTRVAGETSDGFLLHAFTTGRYLTEVTLPALEQGRARTGNTLEGFTIAGPAFTCTGRDEAELASAIAGTKKAVAFYASTAAYRAVLDLHGWGDLQLELSRLTRTGRWGELGDAIDDEVLREFAVVGDPETVGQQLWQRWGGLAARITLYAPYEIGDEVRLAVRKSVHAAQQSADQRPAHRL